MHASHIIVSKRVLTITYHYLCATLPSERQRQHHAHHLHRPHRRYVYLSLVFGAAHLHQPPHLDVAVVDASLACLGKQGDSVAHWQLEVVDVMEGEGGRARKVVLKLRAAVALVAAPPAEMHQVAWVVQLAGSLVVLWVTFHKGDYDFPSFLVEVSQVLALGACLAWVLALVCSHRVVVVVAVVDNGMVPVGIGTVALSVDIVAVHAVAVVCLIVIGVVVHRAVLQQVS
eukprot:m.23017 g.23017  ORF g.23017 m.23017 type:complete len:229 (-) comp8439_c0_seq3:763-1449(-)